MMEPQEEVRGTVILLYIWSKKAPYIPNDELYRIWSHGFVKVKKLENVDNVGAYLTAYLGDMELTEDTDLSNISHVDIKTVDVETDEGLQTKRFIKGARLHMYPSNFNMIRYSRGIKKPTFEFLSQRQAEKRSVLTH